MCFVGGKISILNLKGVTCPFFLKLFLHFFVLLIYCVFKFSAVAVALFR